MQTLLTTDDDHLVAIPFSAIELAGVDPVAGTPSTATGWRVWVDERHTDANARFVGPFRRYSPVFPTLISAEGGLRSIFTSPALFVDLATIAPDNHPAAPTAMRVVFARDNDDDTIRMIPVTEIVWACVTGYCADDTSSQEDPTAWYISIEAGSVDTVHSDDFSTEEAAIAVMLSIFDGDTQAVDLAEATVQTMPANGREVPTIRVIYLKDEHDYPAALPVSEIREVSTSCHDLEDDHQMRWYLKIACLSDHEYFSDYLPTLSDAEDAARAILASTDPVVDITVIGTPYEGT